MHTRHGLRSRHRAYSNSKQTLIPFDPNSNPQTFHQQTFATKWKGKQRRRPLSRDASFEKLPTVLPSSQRGVSGTAGFATEAYPSAAAGDAGGASLPKYVETYVRRQRDTRETTNWNVRPCYRNLSYLAEGASGIVAYADVQLDADGSDDMGSRPVTRGSSSTEFLTSPRARRGSSVDSGAVAHSTTVVIKRFKPDAWSNERCAIQILREVRLLRFLRDSWKDSTGHEALPHHENIVQMLDCFFAPCLENPLEADLYIVMEDGGAPLLSRTVHKLNEEETQRKRALRTGGLWERAGE